jgi:hypothetical protein
MIVFKTLMKRIHTQDLQANCQIVVESEGVGRRAWGTSSDSDAAPGFIVAGSRSLLIPAVRDLMDNRAQTLVIQLSGRRTEEENMRRGFFSTGLWVACLLLAAGLAQAQAQRPYQGSYQSVRQVILRLENRSTNFINAVQSATAYNPNDRYATNADITGLARDFDSALRRLANRFAQRRSTTVDAQDVLTRAASIDDLLRQRPLDARTQNIWTSMRPDLNQLAQAYNLSWSETGTYPPSQTPDRFANRLTGTYRLDMSRSDDPRAAADRATQNLAPSERVRIRELLAQRLQSPDQIALEVRGHGVTIASTRAAKITFDADGRERTETNANGRTIRSRASLNGDQLTVSTTGDRGNDFSVTFDPLGDGRQLNVTRRIYIAGLDQAVTVQSTYDKTADVAQFDIYNPQNYPRPTSGSFIIPDGTHVVGVLDDRISTSTASVGDRFTLRVTQPPDFEGATIEGHISQVQRSGRLTGRSQLTLNFDDLRLRDGRTYSFGGLVEGVRNPNGEVVRVDTEGAVRDTNQTTTTEQRAAIGTAVGAIIGAIAGGGKGAAIGAILGAGAGAGSVYAQGRNDLDLERGTEITIRAGAPAYTTPR